MVSTVGFSALVLDLWRQRQLQLVQSTALFTELVDVLERDRIARRYRLWPERKALLLVGLQARARWVTPLPESHLPLHCRDPKDDRFLACALVGACDYLVTGDQDLLVLNDNALLGKLAILTPRQFIETLPATQP